MRKQYLIPTVIACIFGLLIGLSMALAIVSFEARSRVSALEITFLAPQQAIVFWKTPSPSVGFLRLEKSAQNRATLIKQTSSEANEVHAVMVETIPPEGLYFSLHEEGEPFLMFPEIHLMKYESTTLGATTYE